MIIQKIENCLSELNCIIGALFLDSYDIIDTQPYKNSEDKLIGYSIIVEFEVLDDNKKQYTYYIKFTLAYKYMNILENKNLEVLTLSSNKAEVI